MLREQALGGELVFHILERAEDRLAVVGDGGIVGGAGGGKLGAVAAAGEERQGQRGPNRPDPALPVEERVGVNGRGSRPAPFNMTRG